MNNKSNYKNIHVSFNSNIINCYKSNKSQHIDNGSKWNNDKKRGNSYFSNRTFEVFGNL